MDNPDAVDEGLYHDTLTKAISELGDLMTERETLEDRLEKINRRIVRLRRVANTISHLCGYGSFQLANEHPDLFPDFIDPDTGLTDAVREVLRAGEYFMSPIDVRDSLKAKGYDISKYKNVLASIHTILKRLMNQDEVKEGERDGRTTYKWIPKPDEISDEEIPF